MSPTLAQWGGYTFDSNLFPVPQHTFALLRARGLLTSGNLHDLDGMRATEQQYGPFCAATKAPQCAQNKTVPFAIANETYAMALEDTVLAPMEALGFGDFWWIGNKNEAGIWCLFSYFCSRRLAAGRRGGRLHGRRDEPHHMARAHTLDRQTASRSGEGSRYVLHSFVQVRLSRRRGAGWC